MSATTPPGEHRRIALYSHDTQGLGHIRRNAMLAAAMVRHRPDVSVLLVCGTRAATELPLPPRTQVAVLPAVRKDSDGRYRSAASDAPRRAGLAEVIDLRQRALTAVLGAWAPDVLVVDKVARGVGGELDAVLPVLRRRHGTRTVLGLRDVLDDRASTRREWAANGTTEAIDRHYDAVWIYGDPALFDAAVEYGWPPEVRDKASYTGYLAHGREDLLDARTGAVSPTPGPHPYVLGLVGGGQDGAELARAFAHATRPVGHRGVLVTGPFMPAHVAAELHDIADSRGDLEIRQLVGNVPALVSRAAATVSMGGYNSVCEILAARRPALIVPRIRPRREQLVRAQRMSAAGLFDLLPPEHLTAQAISRWLADAAGRVGRVRGPLPRLDGLLRVPDLLDDVLDQVGTATGRGVRDAV